MANILPTPRIGLLGHLPPNDGDHQLQHQRSRFYSSFGILSVILRRRVSARLRTLTSEDLVEEDLDVVGGERLRRHDHFVQVALHQLRDHVSGRIGSR